MNIVLHFNCNLLELTLFREHLIYSHFFSRSAGRTPRDLKSSKPKPLATFKLLIILYLSLKRTKTSVKDIFFVNYAKEICKKTIVLLQSQQGFLFILQSQTLQLAFLQFILTRPGWPVAHGGSPRNCDFRILHKILRLLS